MNSTVAEKRIDRADRRALRKELERLHREYLIAIEWNQSPNRLSAIKREYHLVQLELRGAK